MKDEGLTDASRYRGLFVAESREYLQSMSRLTMELMQAPTAETYNDLFRMAHSIKGMAATMGFSVIKDVSHAMEDLFDRIKKGELKPGEELVSVLLSGVDLLEVMVTEVEATGGSTQDGKSVLAALVSTRSRTPKAPEVHRPELEVIHPEPQAEQTVGETKFLYRIDLKVSSEASFPAARALVACKRMEELGKISKCIPPLEEITGPNFQKQLSCYLVSVCTALELQEQLQTLPDISSVAVIPIDPHARQSPAAEAESTNTIDGSPPEAVRMGTLRIQTRSLDHVVEGLGELLILNAQVLDTYPESAEVSRLQVLTQQLYESTLDLRMLPFETLAGRLPRIVYDLCRKLQKKVDLKIYGGEIKLDRSVLEELADPLIHLLRNAVDHGIEPVAFRLEHGKPEVGSLSVAVEKRGDRVLITVEDDGRGLDPALIRRTAIQRGLISERAATFLNQHETLMLITRPGFSTARVVSEISGRGVGMDVVRDRIDEIGGAFKIHTIPGKFTRFEMLIPFTVAVIPALLVRSGPLVLAVPSSRIDCFLMIRKNDMHYTQGKPVVFYDNSTIYIENLAALLQNRTEFEFTEEFAVFVTEHQNRRIAWCVDELLEQRQIMLKPLGEPLHAISCYSGATVLGKGEVIPVLDMEQLYRERY
jgi:two-component system chemotaxis sensor kinase CheA